MSLDNNPDYIEPERRLWEATLTMQRGEVLSWQRLEELVGLGPHREQSVTYIAGKFVKRLQADRDILTRVLSGIGIRFLEHEEASILIPAMRQKRAYRQVNKGMRQTACIDGASLTLVARQRLSVQRLNMYNQRLQIGRSKRLADSIGTVSQTNPLRGE